MARTAEPEGWTSQFREIVLDIELVAHDLRNGAGAFDEALDPDSHAAGQALGGALRAAGSDGIAYPSCRHQGGECVALFYPARAAGPVQGRHPRSAESRVGNERVRPCRSPGGPNN